VDSILNYFLLSGKPDRWLIKII